MAKKFYVVWKGRKTGIFKSWDECAAQVNGFPGAEYKAFSTWSEAEKAFHHAYSEYVTGKPPHRPKQFDKTKQLSEDKKITAPIYSDSEIAMGWVESRKCRTKLEQIQVNAELFSLIERAEKWLLENDYENCVLKWWTPVWGEIPADFGRKQHQCHAETKVKFALAQIRRTDLIETELSGIRPVIAHAGHTGDPAVNKQGQVMGHVTRCSIDGEGYLLGLAIVDMRYNQPSSRLIPTSGFPRFPRRMATLFTSESTGEPTVST